MVFDIAGWKCHFLESGAEPKCALVKPLGEFERKNLLMECSLVAERAEAPFAIVAFEVTEKNLRQGGVEATFDFVKNHLVDAIRARYGDLPLAVGGYSLGGLFALWSAMKCADFCAVAACSPSLWVDGWDEWADANPPQASHIYMSIGDKEEKTNKLPFSRVGDRIRRQHERNLALVGEGNCCLTWHQGGHFADTELRKAQGFAWCINAMCKAQK